MFAARLANLKRDISAVRDSVTATERLRRLARSPGPAHFAPPWVCPFEEQAKSFPSSISWRIFDHCATVTRLYAIYERFAIDVLEAWLNALPSLYFTYDDLPQRVQKQHRDGIAAILPQIGEGRFANIPLSSVIERLNDCIGGKSPYSLVAEAFVVRDKNLRGGVLEILFGKAGIPNCWGWIQRHRKVRIFVQETLGSSETADSELSTFVNYRNEAAHGDVSEMLDVHGLVRLADFVEVLCEALAQKIHLSILMLEIENGTYVEIGSVTESFPAMNVVVAQVDRGRLCVGEEVTVSNPQYCFAATIRELQIDGISYPEIFFHAPTEVGIKLDQTVRKNAKLFQQPVQGSPLVDDTMFQLTIVP